MSITAHKNLLSLRACVALRGTFYAQLLVPSNLKDTALSWLSAKVQKQLLL